MKPIKFRPIYQERVWGGRALADKLNRDLPGSAPIGESWELVDRPEAQSIDIATGKTLRELLTESPEALMGPGYDPDTPFPILVKWLDCSDRLSLQVHPPRDIADELGGETKAECWYVADATEEAALIVGLKEGVSREEFEKAIHDETLEPLLHPFPVEPGTSMMLNAGRLHAIDAGNLILEIQQNSDTTYRVYDWGRKGLDGKPRDLHVEQSLKSIDFDDSNPSRNRPDRTRRKPDRRVPGIPDPADQPAPRRVAEFMANEQPQHRQHRRRPAHRAGFGCTWKRSENILLPYSWRGTLTAESPARVLFTDRFV